MSQLTLHEFIILLGNFPLNLGVSSYEDGIRLFRQERDEDGDELTRRTVWVEASGAVADRTETFRPASLAEYDDFLL